MSDETATPAGNPADPTPTSSSASRAAVEPAGARAATAGAPVTRVRARRAAGAAAVAPEGIVPTPASADASTPAEPVAGTNPAGPTAATPDAHAPATAASTIAESAAAEATPAGTASAAATSTDPNQAGGEAEPPRKPVQRIPGGAPVGAGNEPAERAGGGAEPGAAPPPLKRGRTRRTRRTPRAPREKRPAAARRRTAGRVVLAAATVVALGGTVAASSMLALPKVDAAPVSTAVTPAADALRLACAGPLLQLAESAPGQPPALSAVGMPVHATGGSAELTERPLSARLEGTEGRGFAVESALDPAGAAVLGAAAQSQYGSAGLVGLVASACTAPSASSWLVGGSTELGRTTLVNLLNPTDVAATVDLTLVGEDGPVSPPGASGIPVPAGEQVVVPLSGLAPELAAPVVHVASRGGLVVAALQQSIVRGIDPGGIDTIGPTAAPALRQYIPGVRVAGGAVMLERVGVDGHDDLQSVVRVFVPGKERTEVRIGVVADDPQAQGASLAFNIEPHQVVDVPLDPLADGSYTVTIDADLPVVAAVRQSQIASTGGTDFAWLAAPEAIPAGAETWVTITPGPGAHLFLHNPGRVPVTGSLTAADGSRRPVIVEPGGTAALPVVRRQTYRLLADGELRGTVSYLGDGGIAGFPMLPPPAAAQPVTVYPG